MKTLDTPDDLKAAFLSVVGSYDRTDPIILAAIDELVEKITDAYCGEYELTPSEFVLARGLFMSWQERESIWED